MSIHVTVTGNPVCIKKRIILSDLEQIKKNERERRRRLRLAQVKSCLQIPFKCLGGEITNLMNKITL